jgi:hypothetical protein
VSQPIDPENVTQLQPADLAEVEVDETPDELRPQPLEADPADVAEQRTEVPGEDGLEDEDEF